MSNAIHTHVAYETLQQQDGLSYVSQTTPESVKSECEIPAPVKYVVPIIFIPGIMGSNIKDNNDSKVWYPGISTFIPYSLRNARQRQIDLNPQTTTVGYDGNIKLDKQKIPHITKEIARARGWGSVITMSYANLLIYLESQLNRPFKNIKDQVKDQFKGTTEWEKIVQPGNTLTGKIIKTWSSHQSTELLSPEQHEALADYAFPVFACGYNWLDSNMNSANKVADQMNNEVMAQIQKEFPTAKFKQFIIVTHSMGGLVARALIQNDKVKDKIAGVVHGVMPATGAPAVYQRLAVGWDGWKASTGLIKSFKAWASKFMFGDTSKRFTTTLASAPGALELLPFASYSNQQDFPNNAKAWLIIKAQTPAGEITASLPKTNDPYSEIYKRKNSWWAMMNPDFIDPAGLLAQEAQDQQLENSFEVYRRNINIVQKLHEYIQDSYHTQTFAHYAADEGFKAFGQVVWRCKDELNIHSEHELIELINLYGKQTPVNSPNPDNTHKDHPIYLNKNAYKQDGVREILFDEKHNISKNHKATFYLDLKPTANGDGTVCYQSGQDIQAKGRTPKASFMINGYDHAGSYDHQSVQLNTLYCIASIVDSIQQNTQTDAATECKTKAT